MYHYHGWAELCGDLGALFEEPYWSSLNIWGKVQELDKHLHCVA